MSPLTRRALPWALTAALTGPSSVTLAADEPDEEGSSEPTEEAPVEEVVEEVVEEAAVAETPVDGGGLALTRAPPAGKGAIAGLVTDTRYAEPVFEAYVGVVGTKQAVLTDTDGAFRFDLAPGTYAIRIAYDLHRPTQTSEIVVRAGSIVRVDVRLEPDEDVEDVVETVVTLEQSSVAGLLLARQRSAAAGDSIGRAEIAKGSDRTAADAARRVVGANVEGSRFLFVRGLGERYTNALFEGFPLPSPEPDKQAVPLDLFPSQILESLTIVKTFTPDVPGDFAGGSVRIQTRRVPRELTLAGGVSMGVNTQATFQEFLTYDGGSLDWLGIDDGTRALPDSVPDHKVGTFLEKPGGGLQTEEEVARIGRDMNTSQSIRTTRAPPNHAGNFVVANSWAIGSDARVGVLGALVYDRRFEARRDEILRTFGLRTDPDTGEKRLARQNDIRVTRGTDKVSWGGLAGVTLELGDAHRFSITCLHSRVADDEASELQGFHEERSASIVDTRKTFVARTLTFGLFQGEHEIHEAGDLRVAYGVAIARAEREQPDSRGAIYTLSPPVYSFENDGLSGQHFFADQGESTVSGQLDVTKPFGADEVVRVKAGGAFSLRSRDFVARRFNLRPAGSASFSCATPEWDRACPDRLFRDEAIGRDLELVENNRFGDGYEASLDVFAGYAMFDGELHDGLRLVVGPRLEASRQSLLAFDPGNRSATSDRTFDAAETDVLPAVALIYSPTPRSNLRASATRTVARPQIREFAPFAYTDYFGGREAQGNPDLVNTSITNADLRFELFPSTAEVAAVSAFYKRFVDPIEQVVEPVGTNGRSTYQNAEGANLFGVELEGRKSLDVLHPALRPLSVIANVTLAHSRVDLDRAALGDSTSRSRPLSFQAPYMLNAALDFDDEDLGLRARVSYNVVGQRIASVGKGGIPDVYEQPRHVLDVTVAQRIGDHVDVRATGSNLVDSPVRQTHGSEVVGDDSEATDSNVVREYHLGQSFSVGITLSY